MHLIDCSSIKAYTEKNLVFKVIHDSLHYQQVVATFHANFCSCLYLEQCQAFEQQQNRTCNVVDTFDNE